MKQKFSTSWKASSQPRKQRKYSANAPLHLRKKFVSVSLSKELKKKIGKRNIPVKKGDIVKVMRGKFKGTQGKVLEIKLKIGKLTVEGIQVTKMDNSKANVRLQPSNLQIVEMADRKSKSSSSQDSPQKVSKTKELKKEESKETKQGNDKK